MKYYYSCALASSRCSSQPDDNSMDYSSQDSNPLDFSRGTAAAHHHLLTSAAVAAAAAVTNAVFAESTTNNQTQSLSPNLDRLNAQVNYSNLFQNGNC